MVPLLIDLQDHDRALLPWDIINQIATLAAKDDKCNAIALTQTSKSLHAVAASVLHRTKRINMARNPADLKRFLTSDQGIIVRQAIRVLDMGTVNSLYFTTVKRIVGACSNLHRIRLPARAALILFDPLDSLPDFVPDSVVLTQFGAVRNWPRWSDLPFRSLCWLFVDHVLASARYLIHELSPADLPMLRRYGIHFIDSGTTAASTTLLPKIVQHIAWFLRLPKLLTVVVCWMQPSSAGEPLFSALDELRDARVKYGSQSWPSREEWLDGADQLLANPPSLDQDLASNDSLP